MRYGQIYGALSGEIITESCRKGAWLAVQVEVKSPILGWLRKDYSATIKPDELLRDAQRRIAVELGYDVKDVKLLVCGY